VIARTEVLTAVLGVLRSSGRPVGLNGAPHPAPSAYQVVEAPSSPLHDEGDLDDAERHLLVRFRLRSVCNANDREAAALAAVEAGDSARSLLRSTLIEGDGWKVISVETLSTSGVVNEGALANLADDYQLLAVPA